MDQRSLIAGLALIGLGAYLGFVQITGSGGEAIVALIGLAFLGAYAVTRTYGFLIPGSIMTGLGVGILWETQVDPGGGVVVVGLGLGFLAIYVIDRMVRGRTAHWWPLIPGGILTVIGVLIVAGQQRWLDRMEWLGPVVLVAIGAALILAQLRGGRRGTQEPGGGTTDTL
jgi:hypothetical protein